MSAYNSLKHTYIYKDKFQKLQKRCYASFVSFILLISRKKNDYLDVTYIRNTVYYKMFVSLSMCKLAALFLGMLSCDIR